MLDTARGWVQEKLVREPTLLLMLLGIPNVGKSAILNKMYQLTRADFPGTISLKLRFCGCKSSWTLGYKGLRSVIPLVQQQFKRAKVGPLPGVTRNISGFQVRQCVSLCPLLATLYVRLSTVFDFRWEGIQAFTPWTLLGCWSQT